MFLLLLLIPARVRPKGYCALPPWWNIRPTTPLARKQSTTRLRDVVSRTAAGECGGVCLVYACLCYLLPPTKPDKVVVFLSLNGKGETNGQDMTLTWSQNVAQPFRLWIWWNRHCDTPLHKYIMFLS